MTTPQSTRSLYLSLSSCGGMTTDAALTACAALGIKHIELAIGVQREPTVSHAIAKWRSNGMQFRAHHAFVWDHHRPFNLAASFDLDYFTRLTDWLAQHQITAYSVHAGSYTTHKQKAYDQLLAHLERLRVLCQDRGIALGVETMDRVAIASPKQNLLDNLADVHQFLRDAPAIQLVIDLAHLNLWHDNSVDEKLSLLSIPPERILEVHVSDNDGRHDIHSPITPQTWWVPWRDRIPPSVPIVLESRAWGNPEIAIGQVYGVGCALFG